jgi:hypothetical protein
LELEFVGGTLETEFAGGNLEPEVVGGTLDGIGDCFKTAALVGGDCLTVTGGSGLAGGEFTLPCCLSAAIFLSANADNKEGNPCFI